MVYYPLNQPLPPGVKLLYPFGPAELNGKFVVVHGGLDSPGGTFGTFATQEEAVRASEKLNESYRALNAASLPTSSAEPHSPHGKLETDYRTVLSRSLLVASFLLVLSRLLGKLGS